MRDVAWNRWRMKRNKRTKEEYNMTSSECVRIRRQEKRDFERSIVNKCSGEAKLILKFMSSNLKIKGGIRKVIRLKNLRRFGNVR